MQTFLLRIFHIYNLFTSALLHFIPKNLRTPHPHRKKDPPSAAAARTTPRMDSGELHRVFQMFDQNGDGRITKKELNSSLENMGIFIPDTELSQMIHKIDVNGDGCVDIDEFSSLYQNIVDEEDMREAFDVFDQNGDGFITVEELKSVLASLGLRQRAAEDCREMIMRVDGDGDGRVDFKEFKQMMARGGFAALDDSSAS